MIILYKIQWLIHIVAISLMVHKKDLVYLEVNLDIYIAMIISLRLFVYLVGLSWFFLKAFQTYYILVLKKLISLSLLSFVPS